MKKSLAAYCIIWAVLVAWFWIVPGNPMDYSIIAFYLVLPMFAIVGSARMCANGCSLWEALVSTVIMGFGYELCYYFTFSLANMIAMDRLNRFRFHGGLIAMVLPAIGLAIGLIIRLCRRRKAKS